MPREKDTMSKSSRSTRAPSHPRGPTCPDCGERPCLEKKEGVFENVCAHCLQKQKLGVTQPRQHRAVDPAQQPKRRRW